MAIKIKKGDVFHYTGAELLDTKSKKRADEVYLESKKLFNLLNKRKSKLDSLGLWHARGVLANKIINENKLSENEKKFFWVMLYDISGEKTPGRAQRKENDFHTASILAKFPLRDLRSVGPWGLWREILSASKTKDIRVTDWIAVQVLKRDIKKHKDVRPLLKFARNRLKKLDTTVLSGEELEAKLNEIPF